MVTTSLLSRESNSLETPSEIGSGQSSAEALPERTVRCCDRGWPSFWACTVFSAVAAIVVQIMTPSLAIIYFNGGTNPCIGDGKTSSACKIAVQKSNDVTNAFGTVSAILSFIFGPMTGTLADTVGIKKVIVLALVICLMSSFALVGVAMYGVPIYVYFAMNEFRALVPGPMLLQLWIAEATPVSSRATMYGRLMAITSLDGVVAPFISAFASHDGAAMVVVVCLLASTGIAICCISDPPAAKRRNGDDGQTGTSGSRSGCGQISSTCKLAGVGIINMFKHPIYRKIALLTLVSSSSSAGLSAIYLFFLEVRHGIDEGGAAPFLSLTTLSSLLVNVFLVNPAARFMGFKNMMLFSYSAGLLTIFLYMLPSENWMYAASLWSGLGNLAAPAVLAVFTDLVNNDEGGVGISVGIVASLSAVAAIIGPLVFRMVFTRFLTPSAWFPEGLAIAPWILAGIVSIFCGVVTFSIPASVFPKTSTEVANAAPSSQNNDDP